MCLPFICGGDRGDHGSTDHSGIPHPPQPPPPPPPHHPPSPQPMYVTASPVKDAYDDHRTPRMAAGGEAVARARAEAAPWHVPGGNKNGERVTGFDTTHAGVMGAPAAGVHGSAAAASYPKESVDRMRAPPVAQMAEDNYPAAAATTPPAANNFYGGHGHGYNGDYAYGWGQR